jgi:hypothetical protein
MAQDLTREDRQEIGRDIRKTEYGWPLGMPTCDALGDGLWEGVSGAWSRRLAKLHMQDRPALGLESVRQAADADGVEGFDLSTHACAVPEAVWPFGCLSKLRLMKG